MVKFAANILIGLRSEVKFFNYNSMSHRAKSRCKIENKQFSPPLELTLLL